MLIAVISVVAFGCLACCVFCIGGARRSRQEAVETGLSTGMLVPVARIGKDGKTTIVHGVVGRRVGKPAVAPERQALLWG